MKSKAHVGIKQEIMYKIATQMKKKWQVGYDIDEELSYYYVCNVRSDKEFNIGFTTLKNLEEKLKSFNLRIYKLKVGKIKSTIIREKGNITIYPVSEVYIYTK